ncbi:MULTISPECIES: hypothetical protein, partial [unclassified Pseudomonas]|uniref:hypothetical protein n=1 Tax=unclassified Pseudomonas TaxID=196821 RepID=UPI001C48EEA3
VWAKGFKPFPKTQVLQFSEYQGADVVRYCPAGFMAVSSIAVSLPTGQVLCTTQIGNDDVAQLGWSYKPGGCTSGPPDNGWWLHTLTCSKFY